MERKQWESSHYSDCRASTRNVDFYAGVLGLRLVKQTVNFDDPGTYHLYFGNEGGKPGTIITFSMGRCSSRYYWGRSSRIRLTLYQKVQWSFGKID